MSKIIVNGETIELSTEDSAVIAEEQKVMKSEYNAKKAASKKVIDDHESNQLSGNQKLLDLGLTQAEVTALTGYTKK